MKLKLNLQERNDKYLFTFDSFNLHVSVEFSSKKSSTNSCGNAN
jgi:hypothetical protein